MLQELDGPLTRRPNVYKLSDGVRKTLGVVIVTIIMQGGGYIYCHLV